MNIFTSKMRMLTTRVLEMINDLPLDEAKKRITKTIAYLLADDIANDPDSWDIYFDIAFDRFEREVKRDDSMFTAIAEQIKADIIG